MMALGLHEADVAEYRLWHAGGVLHATRTGTDRYETRMLMGRTGPVPVS